MKLTKKHIALVVIFYYDLMAQQVKNPPAMQETQEPRLDPWLCVFFGDMSVQILCSFYLVILSFSSGVVRLYMF